MESKIGPTFPTYFWTHDVQNFSLMLNKIWGCCLTIHEYKSVTIISIHTHICSKKIFCLIYSHGTLSHLKRLNGKWWNTWMELCISRILIENAHTSPTKQWWNNKQSQSQLIFFPIFHILHFFPQMNFLPSIDIVILFLD